MITFEQDIFFFIAVLLLAGALLVLVYGLVKRNPRAYAHTLFHLFLWASILLVFAQPFYREELPSTGIPLFVDVSESMNVPLTAEYVSALKRSVPEEKLIIYPFASAGEALKRARSSLEYQEFVNRVSARAETNIEQIIPLAESYGRKALLLSDGYENKGDILSRLAESSISLYPLLPKDVDKRESGFELSNLSAPMTASAGKSVDVQVTAANTSPQSKKGTLEITQDGKSIFREAVSLGRNGVRVFHADSDSSNAGLSELVATLTPADKTEPQIVLRRYLTRLPEEKILLLSGTADDARFIYDVLGERNFKVAAYVGQAPTDLFRKEERYKAVILNNIAASALSPLLIQDIASYVREGGGLLMIGGNKSFGLGGYQRTPVEEVLPVKLLTPKKEQKRLNVAVELVLDKSRSMSFGNKIEYAKEAAREVIRNLKDDDYIGIIGFDTTPFIVFPLRRLATNRSMALTRVGSLFPVGKTNLFPAMDEARRSLVQAEAGRKHMIVLTDGKIPDGGSHYLDLVQQMRSRNITVSTVMMGSEADTRLLQSMAEQGGGAFYQTADARSLPRIFLSDIKVSTGEKTLREQREYVVRKGEGELQSTTITRFPSVRGYVQTQAKEKANVELIAFAAGTAEPLLASWKYQKGKATAFTSDANGRWSNSWIRWPYFRQFWVELVESVDAGEKGNEDQVNFDLRHVVDHGRLVLELIFYEQDPSAAVQGVVAYPDGREQRVSFVKVTAGRYKAEVADISAGKYVLKGQLGKQDLPPVAIDLPGELFGEKKGQDYRTPFLYRVAAMSGGEVNPDITKLFAEQDPKVEKRDLTHWAFLLVLFFFLLKIFSREVLSRSLGFLSQSRRQAFAGTTLQKRPD